MLVIAAAATPEVRTLNAKSPVVTPHVAQVQSLGQVVGAGGVDAAAQEQRHARDESTDGGFVPGFGMSGIGFNLSRQFRKYGHVLSC